MPELTLPGHSVRPGGYSKGVMSGRLYGGSAASCPPAGAVLDGARESASCDHRLLPQPGGLERVVSVCVKRAAMCRQLPRRGWNGRAAERGHSSRSITAPRQPEPTTAGWAATKKPKKNGQFHGIPAMLWPERWGLDVEQHHSYGSADVCGDNQRRRSAWTRSPLRNAAATAHVGSRPLVVQCAVAAAVEAGRRILRRSLAGGSGWSRVVCSLGGGYRLRRQ